jgi:hypothetical protein
MLRSGSRSGYGRYVKSRSGQNPHTLKAASPKHAPRHSDRGCVHSGNCLRRSSIPTAKTVSLAVESRVLELDRERNRCLSHHGVWSWIEPQSRHRCRHTPPHAAARKATSASTRHFLRLDRSSNLRVGGSSPSRRAIETRALSRSSGSPRCAAT